MIIQYKEVDIQHDEDMVLYNVNMTVHEGEFVYLTGVVGSGKSSLLKTIYGELDITNGSALVLGQDMRRIKRRHIPALRKQLGIVFQDFRLLTDRNVRQNLDFVLRCTGWKNRTERAGRIAEVLKTVGLSDKIEAMPYELSGGEQQRVCIARAILNSPKLILADEATGNQDEESGIRTAHILYELSKQGTAVIMATHNNALISQFPGTVYDCKDHQLTLQEPITPSEDASPKETDASPKETDASPKETDASPVEAAPTPDVVSSPAETDIPMATVATTQEEVES